MGCGNSSSMGAMYSEPIGNPGVEETPVYRNP